MFLNTENIARSGDGIEYHPLLPFLPAGCRVLFLGSFPPQRKRWCIDFYYPNFINDHWRIEGLVFFGDRNYFLDTVSRTFRMERIIPFLTEKGIGFHDTATAVRRLRDNASDKYLEVVQPTDLSALLAAVPECRAVVTTGEKATATLCDALGIPQMPCTGQYVPIPGHYAAGRPMVLYRLPSSSRAYPLSLEKKAGAYRSMFEYCGIEV
ncbi:MAG: uracil-DNA glycosylase family protein [Bacteroidaceae bacterium]|nr:uracil-DNA glycosylase family protein [Bacteroidaceae bacterium]